MRWRAPFALTDPLGKTWRVVLNDKTTRPNLDATLPSARRGHHETVLSLPSRFDVGILLALGWRFA